jgi:hypothetical protein
MWFFSSSVGFQNRMLWACLCKSSTRRVQVYRITVRGRIFGKMEVCTREGWVFQKKTLL